MAIRRFAQVFGVVYLIVGVLGFVPQLLTPVTSAPGIGALSGDLLGIFPVNVVHDIVHLILGAWGLLAFKTVENARTFSRYLAVILGVLAVLGFIPGPASTLFGLAPLYSPDTWLHLASALVAAYFGWGVAVTDTSTA